MPERRSHAVRAVAVDADMFHDWNWAVKEVANRTASARRRQSLEAAVIHVDSDAPATVHVPQWSIMPLHDAAAALMKEGPFAKALETLIERLHGLLGDERPGYRAPASD